MNYQKMRNAPMNYQLDQNRAFNYQRQSFSSIPSVKWVKTNGQTGHVPFYMGACWKMMVVHGGKEEDGGSS
jgi:hypothetical protein